jgi:hypothetical protein
MKGKVTRDTPTGTKVRLIANTCVSCNKVGDIGVIIRNTGHGCYVDAGHKSTANWSCYTDLEIVSQFTDNYEIC